MSKIRRHPRVPLAFSGCLFFRLLEGSLSSNFFLGSKDRIEKESFGTDLFTPARRFSFFERNPFFFEEDREHFPSNLRHSKVGRIFFS